MAFRWRADDDPTLNAGSVASYFFRGSGPELQRNPIFFNFSGGGGCSVTRVPPLDPHMNEFVVCVISGELGKRDSAALL